MGKILTVDYYGLCDLWDDFTTAIADEEVDLTEAKICQVESVGVGKDGATYATIWVTDAADSKPSPKKGMMKVEPEMKRKLEYAGCFYVANGKRYIPSEEVKRRYMYDFFHLTSDFAISGTSEKEYAVLLAKQFRAVGSIVFASRKPEHKFRTILGLKAVKSADALRTIDLARAVHGKHGDGAVFLTDYTCQKEASIQFTYTWAPEGIASKNGVPLGVRISDYANGRKSIEADIVALVDGKAIVLDSADIRHSTAESAGSILEGIEARLAEMSGRNVDISLSAEEILERSSQLIPKAGRAMFEQALRTKALLGMRPVCAAYEAAESGTFNSKNKQHRTQVYDGGKRKYFLGLGKAMQSA